jgi:hypothetical protein
MSATTARPGQRFFIPSTEQRNNVKVMVGLGIPHAEICRMVLNSQTDKPIDQKTLVKHFSREIESGTTEVHVRLGNFLLANVFGMTVPAGTTAIKDDRMRGHLVEFVLKTKFGWRETILTEHANKDGKPSVVDDARQRLIDEVDRARARKEEKGE